MSLVNALELLNRRGYALELEHPRTGTTTIEAYGSMRAVIARASQVMEAGYRIGIWSPASCERKTRSAETPKPSRSG